MATLSTVTVKQAVHFLTDTDTYIIGLTNHKQGAQTFVDLTPVGSEDTKIMNLNEFKKKPQDLIQPWSSLITTRYQPSYNHCTPALGVIITPSLQVLANQSINCQCRVCVLQWFIE